MIICQPTLKGVIRYESIHTGMRPWCIASLMMCMVKNTFTFFSQDHDGVNRVWMADEDIDFDARADGEMVEIKSQLMTRFSSEHHHLQIRLHFQAHTPLRNFTGIWMFCVRTREAPFGEFSKDFTMKHYNTDKIIRGGAFMPIDTQRVIGHR